MAHGKANGPLTIRQVVGEDSAWPPGAQRVLGPGGELSRSQDLSWASSQPSDGHAKPGRHSCVPSPAEPSAGDSKRWETGVRAGMLPSGPLYVLHLAGTSRNGPGQKRCLVCSGTRSHGVVTTDQDLPLAHRVDVVLPIFRQGIGNTEKLSNLPRTTQEETEQVQRPRGEEAEHTPACWCPGETSEGRGLSG